MTTAVPAGTPRAASRPIARHVPARSSSRVDSVFTPRGALLYAMPVTLVLFLLPLAQEAIRPGFRYLTGSPWADATIAALLFLAVFGVVYATFNAHRRMRATSGAEAALAGWSSRRV